MSICNQCPRRCGVDREKTPGFCRAPEDFSVARVGLHLWEEPVLCGEKGAGTIFFAGCNLRCVFCQNRAISRGTGGKPMTAEELAAAMLDLQSQGAACIDLVTPTHYVSRLIPVLRTVKPKLRIPVVYNCGGYESVDSLRALEGLVDVYLPDCKYFSDVLARSLSSAPDYFATASAALAEMLRQTGAPVYAADGSLLRGVIVRHLVLPGHRADSIALLRALAERFGPSRFLLSLMAQYTPDFLEPGAPKSLARRLTSFEYQSVLQVAADLGFTGFSQSPSSASASYTPEF